jgi:hypothetical protein
MQFGRRLQEGPGARGGFKGAEQRERRRHAIDELDSRVVVKIAFARTAGATDDRSQQIR